MQTGDPVILTNAKDLGKYGFRKGLKGTCNAITHVDGVAYAMFRPNNQSEFFYIKKDRLVVDEEALGIVEQEESDDSSDR